MPAFLRSPMRDEGGGGAAGGVQMAPMPGKPEEPPVQQACDCGGTCASCSAGAPVQLECATCDGPVQMWSCGEYQEPTCVQSKESGEGSDGGARASAIHGAARAGLAGASSPLPHGER